MPKRIHTDSKVTVDLVADEASVFLLKHGRKTIPITGDGNCLFRCFSLILFGDQDQHLRVRTSLVDFIKKNPSFFTTYCLPLTVPEHSQRMANNFVWGTHVEIFAASLYFNLPIYVAVAKADETYFWCKFGARQDYAAADHAPTEPKLVLPEDVLPVPPETDHV